MFFFSCSYKLEISISVVYRSNISVSRASKNCFHQQQHHQPASVGGCSSWPVWPLWPVGRGGEGGTDAGGRQATVSVRRPCGEGIVPRQSTCLNPAPAHLGRRGWGDMGKEGSEWCGRRWGREGGGRAGAGRFVGVKGLLSNRCAGARQVRSGGTAC